MFLCGSSFSSSIELFTSADRRMRRIYGHFGKTSFFLDDFEKYMYGWPDDRHLSQYYHEKKTEIGLKVTSWRVISLWEKAFICIEGRHLHREKAFLLSDQNNLNILCSPPIFIMKSSSPGINSGRFEDVLLHVLHSWGASYFGGGIRVKFSYINFITGRRNGHIRIFTSSNRMQCAALLILLLPP